ncbi:MAG: hypothetical protein AB7D51_02880 [Desulfovibrionaceae bacterium]
MKLVEGQIETLRFFRQLSGLSTSIASNIFREYIDMLDRALKQGFGDIVPRTVDPHPVVDKEGNMTSEWIQPERESGRIVSRNS